MLKGLFAGVLLGLLFLLAACNNQESDPQPAEKAEPKAQLTLEIRNLADSLPIVFHDKQYRNAKGQAFNITDFKYYLSNIRLRNRETGQLYEEPKSYHLIEPSTAEPTVEITLPEVDTGTYTELEFSIGVDNVMNHSNDFVGDLDPINNMLWTWNTGYKFVLMEGNYFRPDSSKQALIFHVGLDENFRTLRYELPKPEAGPDGRIEPLVLGKNTQAKAQVSCQLLGLFNNPNEVDFESLNNVHNKAGSGTLATNYGNGMFALEALSVQQP